MKSVHWFVFMAAMILAGGIWLYNRMVGLRKRALGAWSDIDVQLKRRHDLVPSLVACTRGYMQHERNALLQVTEARQRAQSAHTVVEKGLHETELAGMVKSLLLLVENYPDLKANSTFLDLQKKLTETEDLIQYARRYYNAVVRDYNTLITQFPNVWVARIGGFPRMEFFQLDSASEAQAGEVSLTV